MSQLRLFCAKRPFKSKRRLVVRARRYQNARSPLPKTAPLKMRSPYFTPGTDGSIPVARLAYNQTQSMDFALYAGGTAVIMMGAAYASVPLYQTLCKKFGWGGNVANNAREKKDLMRLLDYQQNRNEKAKERRYLVTFNTSVNPGMPWYFQPTQEYVIVRPGETALAFFTTYNDSTRPITGVSTYNIQPYNAAPYFRKVQCFCFEEQRVRGKEKVDMPVLFYLDPEILGDPALKDCYDINLSYTFFEVEEELGPVEWDEPGDWDDDETTAPEANLDTVPTPEANPIESMEKNFYYIEQGGQAMAETVQNAHESRNTPGRDKFKSSWERALISDENEDRIRAESN